MNFQSGINLLGSLLLIFVTNAQKLSAHYAIINYGLPSLAHVKRKLIVLRWIQSLISIASIFLCMMGCVYGALVTSAIKSMTLEYLLISISVNLEAEKCIKDQKWSGKQLRLSDRNNILQWIAGCAVCTTVTLNLPSHRLGNWTACAKAKAFVIRAQESV